MIKNYLKTAWRNARTNFKYTAISLFSLVLGITLFLLIIIWVKHEFSFDKQFSDAGQIYRVETRLTMQDGIKSNFSAVGWPVGNILKTEYPEIENVTYLRDWNPDISLNGNHFFEQGLFADNEFLEIFSYPLSAGNAATALSQPYSIVISKSLQKKYFGNQQNIIGKTIMINDTVPYTVTGIFKDLSAPSHLKFEMIGSMSSLCAANSQYCKEEFASGWFDLNMYNYVKLRKNAKYSEVNMKIKDMVLVKGKEIVAQTGIKAFLQISPLKDIYLHSGMATGNGSIGNIKTVQLFFLVGIFILLIACLNFVNLTTAKSVERAKEIGIRKVMGSDRKELMFQFLTETAILCAAATILSLALMAFLLPWFNHFSGEQFGLATLFSNSNILMVAIIILLLIPLAGFYPAWVFSSYNPIKVLKGSFSHSFSGVLLRKGLVVTQFVISVAFIMGTLIIWKQMKFMRNQNLGFDKNKVLILDVNKVPWTLRQNNSTVFKNELLSQSGIKEVTSCNAVPGHTGWGSQFAWAEGNPKDAQITVEYIPVDENYLGTLDLKLSAGRNFLSGSPVDSNESLIINEAALKIFGWSDPGKAIGKKLNTSGKEGLVIGVLKDYHHHGLQQKINPIVLGMGNFTRFFAIRYNAISPKQATQLVQSAWEKVYAGYPLEYSFMDEDFQRQYEKEARFETLFSIASAFSILIACMGLLGLTIFTVQKRMKEIGIRKVLGANTLSIIFLLSKEFLKLVLMAIILAAPIAWWGMSQWLQEFAYRIHINGWVFLIAGASTLIIAITIISFQAIRSAFTNPVESLRRE